MTPQVLVLIADDEEPIAEVVATVVEDAGYTPLLAGHGREALELVRALVGVQLVGADVVEVSPPYDQAGITSMLAANILPKGKMSPMTRLPRPTGRVREDSGVMKTQAKGNSFQALVTAKRATVRRAGVVRGRMMRQKV